jgi:hypothetical protein
MLNSSLEMRVSSVSHAMMHHHPVTFSMSHYSFSSAFVNLTHLIHTTISSFSHCPSFLSFSSPTQAPHRTNQVSHLVGYRARKRTPSLFDLEYGSLEPPNMAFWVCIFILRWGYLGGTRLHLYLLKIFYSKKNP